VLPSNRYRWVKNGFDFLWQSYDDRISQQPGRGTLVITTPRDEDIGQFLIYYFFIFIILFLYLIIKMN